MKAVNKNGRRKRPLRVPGLIGICVAVLLLSFYLALKLIPFPELKAFMQRQNSTRFYDSEGKLVYVLPLEDGLRREYFPLEEIPESLSDAFLEQEDSHFYFHPGVDFISIARAALQNKKAGRVVSGASTITMQLARIIVPRTETVSYKTKLKEMISAFRIEAKLGKKQILELYLNSVPFGFQTEGVASAARTFYGISMEKLSDEQIEVLAKIPRRPSDYAPKKSYVYENRCPHFIQYVAGQYRKAGKKIPDSLILSVDTNLASRVEKKIQEKLDEYTEARVHNGSAFAINNRTGQIILWVGNASFNDSEHSGQIDGVLVRNNPGSSMKPFLYAHALENGFSPTTILPDIRQDFGGSGVYVPYNFNNMFNGPVSFRNALASSLNVPAVYLLNEVGIDSYLERLSKLGYEDLEKNRATTGLSLALGAAEVSLYEMVRAFSVFPNDGRIAENLSFLKDETCSEFRKVYESDTARIICDFLSDSNARALGFGNAKVFETDYPSIFKTGTSNQFQNIIALGATSEFTAGVWMGNFAGETVVRQTGSSIPAAVVRMILDFLSDRYGACSFQQPELYEKRSVCALSGLTPGENCPAKVNEYVFKGTEKNRVCDWHYSINGRIAVRYPEQYAHWASGRNMNGSLQQNDLPVQIVYPRDNAQFVFDPLMPSDYQKLHVMATGGGSRETTLFADGKMIGSTQGILEWDIPLLRGMHELKVVCGDSEDVSVYTVR